MKQKLLTIFLFLTVFNSKGQVIESIGIKGGCSITNLTWFYKSINLTNKTDYKTGFYSTLTTELFKTKYTSILTDLGFVQKGGQQKIEITTSDKPEGTGVYSTWTTTINYLTFSPLLKIYHSINNLTPYAFIGPHIDYQVGYHSNFASNMGDDLTKTIWGLTYGAGIEYKKNKVGVLLEFQNHLDLSSIKDTEPKTTNAGMKITGNAYIIITGIRYYFH